MKVLIRLRHLYAFVIFILITACTEDNPTSEGARIDQTDLFAKSVLSDNRFYHLDISLGGDSIIQLKVNSKDDVSSEIQKLIPEGVIIKNTPPI